MFEKILIANRGEIACRIMRTARRMGIQTVAIYSDADAGALHTRMADEAVCVGPGPAAQSYLQLDTIVNVARETGTQAVHPGFGFLAENAEFAGRLTDAGIAFIGPKPYAIGAMGDKIESKKLADAAGVNTIPGHPEALGDAEQAVAVAAEIGLPVMLKASAGGGGKGMRVAYNEAEVRDGFNAAVSEATSSFGDGRVFAEKFIEQPRHIEVQVLADQHGNVLYLGERECSIQRRHQKVIEEAPSPFIDAATRARMGEQAVALARAVDYESAGTVEFVVDAARNFYFLEMNTRLQVEHPVTEFVTGLDIVELMLRVATGEELSIKQDSIRMDSWAMEARIYAEDPDREFLPSIGRLTTYIQPTESAHVRVDSGVVEGDEISIYYDPMLAKLITVGPDREAAREHLLQALDAYCIRGVQHNVAFLSAIVGHQRFAAGDISTAFIDEQYPEGFSSADVATDQPELLPAVAAVLQARVNHRDASAQQPDNEPMEWDYVAIAGGHEQQLRLTSALDLFEVSSTSHTHRIEMDWRPGLPVLSGHADGEPFVMQVERLRLGWRLTHRGAVVEIQVMSPRAAQLRHLMPVKQAADSSRFLLAPMPGLLVRISVHPGDVVKSGQELAVVEAMKMENSLRAARDGIVSTLLAAPNDSLAVDQPILEFE